MDSLTQLTLGATVGDAVLGKQAGRKAAAWGAVLGTFPDLDVFIPMGGAVADFVYHRSFSHSLFILAALTPLWAKFIVRWHPAEQPRFKRWLAMIYAVFVTHVLIDSVTVYGTQIFWPISNHPVSIGSFFIIDPLYTLPLILGGIVYLFFRQGSFGYRANLGGLIFSTGYLLAAIGIQAHVRSVATASLAKQQLPHAKLLVIPTPFNTVLWRLVAMDRDGYHVGYYSLLDPPGELAFRKISNNNESLTKFSDHPPAQQLEWFTHGFYSLDYLATEQRWVMSDIRMGVEPDYVFRFVLAEATTPDASPGYVDPIQLPRSQNVGRLGLIWDRMFDPTVTF